MTRRVVKVSEEDVAGVVVDHLVDLGWEVYQEVDHAVGVADIVARSGNLLWVVEVKKSLSLQLLAQAARWRWYAHYVSVAVPQGKRRDVTYGFAARVLEAYGIGLLEVSHRNRSVDSTLPPSLMRKALAANLANSLVEEQKFYARAGNSSGRKYTRWGATRDRLVAYVYSHPGCTIKEAIDAIDHHYRNVSAARASMSELILTQKIPAIRAQRDDPPTGKTRKSQRPSSLKLRGPSSTLKLYPVVYEDGPKNVPATASPIGFWDRSEPLDLYAGASRRTLLFVHRYMHAASTMCRLGSGLTICPMCEVAIPYTQLRTPDDRWVFPSTFEHLFSRHAVAPPIPEFLMDAYAWYSAISG